MPLTIILLVFSFVLLICSAFGISPPRCQLGWLGLALFVLTFIIK